MAEQDQQKLLKKSGYSETAIRYFLGRKHVGELADATTTVSYKGPCGDIMEFMLKIDEGRIADIRFQAIGCAASYASGEALCFMVEGMELGDAEHVTETDILNHLGGLPDEKLHCAKLAIRTFRRALYNYLLKTEAESRPTL
jgi:nitrogen fixation NifU-like protein